MIAPPRPRVALVVAAGGSGRRMGGAIGVRKQYLELAGEPVLVHALRPFLALPELRWVVVALPRQDAGDPPDWLVQLDARLRVVAGGAERTDSVRAALSAVPPEADVVLVHDAARPLVTLDLIARVIEAAWAGSAAIPGVAVEDTIKEVDESGTVLGTVDRGRLRRVQTPQGFRRELLLEAHRRAQADGAAATDDAALVERIGGRVVVVEGSAENVKITGPQDLVLAEAILRRRGA